MFKLMLLFVFIVTLSACTSNGNNQNEAERLHYLSYQEDYTIERIRTEPTGGYEDEVRLTAIDSLEALQAYYEEHQDQFDLEAFKTFIDTYDASVFDEKLLLVVVIEEPSGSISHGVEDLYLDEDNLMVEINRNVPDIGTTDMACWHLLIEVDKDNHDFESVDLTIK